MKLSLGPVSIAAMALSMITFAVGCAGSEPAGDAYASESNATEAAPIAPGKYVADGKMLMIYSACSEANFLGDAATGAIASGTMRAPEGDVCGGYKLAAGNGQVTVTWDRDPTAHLDAAAVAACKSQEGTYLMTAASSFNEPKPGTYAKPNSAATFTIPNGCAAPATLSGGGAPIARSTSDAAHPAGFMVTDEGNVCAGYTYTGLPDGSLRVTWAPPSQASIAHDLGIGAACKSVEGIYKPR
jgi:hypothetical protein